MNLKDLSFMPEIQLPRELMRKVHALMAASRNDRSIPRFPDEASLIMFAVRQYLAKHAAVSLYGATRRMDRIFLVTDR